MDARSESIGGNSAKPELQLSKLALKSGEANPKSLKAICQIAQDPDLRYSEAAEVTRDATRVFQHAFADDKGWEAFSADKKLQAEAQAAYEKLSRMSRMHATLEELTKAAQEFPGGKDQFKERRLIRQFLTGGYPPSYEPYSRRGKEELGEAKKAMREIEREGLKRDKDGRLFYRREDLASELRVSSREVTLTDDSDSIGRIYLNPRPETWGSVFNYLSLLLANRRDLPFKLKTFDPTKEPTPLDLMAGASQQWEILNAGDKVVLYFDKADEDLISSIVLHTHAEVKKNFGAYGSFDDKEPVFADRFKNSKGEALNGIAFAQEPSANTPGYSFNTILQEIIENNWESLGTPQFEEGFRKGLQKAGRDPVRPAFNNPASSTTKAFPSIARELL